jgi:hypothetical protein
VILSRQHGGHRRSQIRRMIVTAAGPALALMPLLLVAGCSTASSPRPAVGASVHRSAPVTVDASPLGCRYGPGCFEGRIVHPLSTRVFPTAKRGFALAVVRGALYPSTTTNGGKTWRIDGPSFYAPGAQAPRVVTYVGAARPGTYFAFGGGGTAVDVTSDSGKRWWQAFLGDLVLAVVPSPKGSLVAITQELGGHGGKAVTWVYVSNDGGRHWHYTNKAA